MAAEEKKELDFVEEWTKWAKDNKDKVYEDEVLKGTFTEINKGINGLISNVMIKTFEEVFLYAYQKGYEDCKKELGK